jgi:hypothetical protein
MVSPFALATGMVSLIVLAGAAHTLWRYWFGRAVDYLPAGVLSGPVVGPLRLSGDKPQEIDVDPLSRASAGALYLHQHNIGDLIEDLERRPRRPTYPAPFVRRARGGRPGRPADVIWSARLLATR